MMTGEDKWERKDEGREGKGKERKGNLCCDAG